VCLGHCKQCTKSINTELPPVDCEVGPERIRSLEQPSKRRNVLSDSG
jgi:hypothetical protein